MPATFRCPRCKSELVADDADALADDAVAHLRDVHGHEPPRDHVTKRIARQNEDGGG